MTRSSANPSATVAAFDIGSNTSRGILAEPIGDGALRVLAAEQRMTALGRGLTQTRRLDPGGLAATVHFVAEMMLAWGRPPHAWAVATAAARGADNADELLGRLREVAGIDAEVIAGEHEARLAWLGALSTDPGLAAHDPVVVDIGGRSTEVVAESHGGLHADSRPIGARSLTESLGSYTEPECLDGLGATVAATLALGDAMAPARDCGVLVAIGGTAQAAAHLLGKRRIAYDELCDLERELSRLSPEERRRHMRFDPDRAEIICAGLVILSIFAHAAPQEQVVVSDGGVREGLLLDRTGATRLEWSNECFT